MDLKDYSPQLNTLLNKIAELAEEEAQDKKRAKNDALVILVDSAKEARSLYPNHKGNKDGNFLDKLLFCADIFNRGGTMNRRWWLKEGYLLSLRRKQCEFMPKTKKAFVKFYMPHARFTRPYQYGFHYKGTSCNELSNLR